MSISKKLGIVVTDSIIPTIDNYWILSNKDTNKYWMSEVLNKKFNELGYTISYITSLAINNNINYNKSYTISETIPWTIYLVDNKSFKISFPGLHINQPSFLIIGPYINGLVDKVFGTISLSEKINIYSLGLDNVLNLKIIVSSQFNSKYFPLIQNGSNIPMYLLWFHGNIIMSLKVLILIDLTNDTVLLRLDEEENQIEQYEHIINLSSGNLLLPY